MLVSSDRELEPFTSYWGSMPWLALPYHERDLAAQLKAQFKVC